jgi:hypothetical protein
LRRWRRDPRFSAALSDAQARAYDEALGLLRTSALDGVRTLREVALDPSVPPAARVSAARVLLEYSVGRYDSPKIDARVTVEPEVSVEHLCEVLGGLAASRVSSVNGVDLETLPAMIEDGSGSLPAAPRG